MWNDTDTPIAYLITFRTHGTWLHGHERGSVDRHNNVYGTPRIPTIEHWEKISRDRLKNPPVKLNAAQRAVVEVAIRETCSIRTWGLYTLNIRTNHAHIVLSAASKNPGIVMTALKANSTRHMRQNGLWRFNHSPWAEKGSKRYLWNERHLIGAIDYVNFGQGDELPMFD